MINKFQISNVKCQISNKKLETRNWILDIGNSCYRQAGFTIIEFIIYIGIFSILITVLTNLFFSILDSQENSEATAAADENGQYITSRFSYDISRAQSVSIPTTAGGQSNSLQISINNINYTYSLDSQGNLQLVNNSGTDNLNGYDVKVSNLSFQRFVSNDGKNSVKISYSVTSKTIEERGAQVRNFQTTVSLRCKTSGC